jgi:hypothetical protein
MDRANSSHDIFTQIKKLGLPIGHYVVVGGGVLVALGLHEWDGDVDFAVSQDIFDKFVRQGWRQDKEATKTVLRHKDYDVGVNFGEWNLDELLADALIIKDIPFVSLDKLILWKRRRNLPKDQRHIKMIEEYQQRIK